MRVDLTGDETALELWLNGQPIPLPPAPPAPADVSASQDQADGIHLTWSPCPWASGYRVERADGATWVTASAQALDDTIAPGEQASYTVQALGEGGTSPASVTVQGSVPLPEHDIRIQGGAVVGVSHLLVGASQIDSPSTWRQPGWSNAKVHIGSGLGTHAVQLYPFGLPNPWQWTGTGPRSPLPNNLHGEVTDGGSPAKPATRSFAGALKAIQSLEATAPLTVALYGAEWWMKGRWGRDGTVTPCTYADRYTSDGRVMREYLDEWQTLVQAAVQLALAAGVRTFYCWNELKAFWDFRNNKWDMLGSSGNGAVGYVEFYRVTWQGVKAACTAAGVQLNEVRYGGPYFVIRTSGSGRQIVGPGHLLYGRPWGSMDADSHTALVEFLDAVVQGRDRFDVLVTDVKVRNQDDVDLLDDDPLNLLRWSDYPAYLQNELDKRNLDVPIHYAEYYTGSLRPVVTEEYLAVLRAEVLRRSLYGGIEWLYSWGVTDQGQKEGAELITSVKMIGGGQPQPFHALAQIFKLYFGPGTTLAAVDVTGAGEVTAVASDNALLILNRDNVDYRVLVGNRLVVTVPATGWDLIALDKPQL